MTTQFKSIMSTVQTAVLEARKANHNIGVAVSGGRFQIQEITYGNDGVSTVAPLSAFVSLQDCINGLKVRS